jgi:hypothetical protein
MRQTRDLSGNLDQAYHQDRLTFGGVEIDRNEDREKQLCSILVNCENGSNVNISSCSQSEKHDLPSVVTEDGI